MNTSTTFTMDRWLTAWPRTRLIGWWRYGRRWARQLTTCHLTGPADARMIPPRLRIEIGVDGVDRLLVRMLPGQCPADWENRTTRLAAAFGATRCHATLVGPAIVELLFYQPDSLAEEGVL
ncbi:MULTISPECIES: hypothetical protein [unclassified Nocardia]|uniref:hypothetical protein n=1 Tax=unclassified Nocardia TaxID=2637762 RepID=UPI001CE45406|nr:MULTISPECIES: hypothetical protein [unclassified Nocardia]